MQNCRWLRSYRPESVEGSVSTDQMKDYVDILLGQEVKTYAPCMKYLKDPSAMALVNTAWRQEMCEWCYNVVDYVGFDREVVSIAFNYVDRAMIGLRQTAKPVFCDKSRISKRELQLITLTCLYIAIKTHGNIDDGNIGLKSRQKTMNLSTYVALGRGIFEAEVIEAMELQILFVLEWRLNPPTCSEFISCLLRSCPLKDPDRVGDVARYLAELSVCVSDFSYTCKDSVLAYACIDRAIELLSLGNDMELKDDACSVFISNMAKVRSRHPDPEEIWRTRQMVKYKLWAGSCVIEFLSQKRLLLDIFTNNMAKAKDRRPGCTCCRKNVTITASTVYVPPRIPCLFDYSAK